MNKIKFITKSFVIAVFLLSLSTSLGASAEAARWTERYTTEVLEERMEMMDGAFDYKLTPEIKTIIENYTRRYRKSSEALLGRTSVYFPLFEKRLEEKNLPQELKYVAVIESNLHPYARSVVGAAGLWQFMKPTGRMMGLKVNRVIDERNDPIKSTDAALEYLAYLYEMFDDWTLAIAAYNCGPGNVKKAIRRSNSTDFWKMRRFLPRETRKYVPKFMAMSYTMNYYMDHGLVPSDEAIKENPTTAKIFTQINFRKLSDILDMELSDIKKLNPAYLRNYIPRSEEGYYLTLPEDKLYNFVFEHGTEFEVVYMPLPPKVEEEVIAEEEVEEEIPVSREIVSIPILENLSPSVVLYSASSNDAPGFWNFNGEIILREEKFYDRKKSFNIRGKELEGTYYNAIILSSIDLAKRRR